MKKTKLIISLVTTCLFIVYGKYAYCQTEFAPIGAEWYYTDAMMIPLSHFNHIVSEKDTIVAGETCRVLQQNYFSTFDRRETYIIKQEQGKIYYYYQDKFHLMLDFSAEVKDTVEFTFRYQIGDSTHVNVLKDTIISARFVIENITTDAHGLKTVTPKILEEDEYLFKYVSLRDLTFPYVYTEKIGLHSEFLPLLDDMAHPDCEFFRYLRCYTDADLSFVSNQWTISLPCNYVGITGINTFENENVKVYPNPFYDYIFVNTENEGNIEIIDILGKTIYQSKLTSGVNAIFTNHFSKGIFFIRIQNDSNFIQNFKIVKL